MKTGDTGLNKYRHKDSRLRFNHVGAAIKRDRLADSQFIIDEDFRRLSVNCTDSLYGKSSAVFCAAAVFIGADVGIGGEPLGEEVVVGTVNQYGD